MSGLWLGIFLAFGVLTDYTIQNNQIPKIDWTPDPIVKERVIYYDVIEVGNDGMHTIERDSIVYYDKVKLFK